MAKSKSKKKEIEIPYTDFDIRKADNGFLVNKYGSLETKTLVFSNKDEDELVEEFVKFISQ